MTVVLQPEINSDGAYSDIIVNLASVAETFIPWGRNPAARDRQLRGFWPTEPVLASAIGSTVSRYAAFGWTLKGPPELVYPLQTLFHGFEHGEGWTPLIAKTLIDLFTQDNGAFIEVVRTGPQPTDPVVCLNHLDSNRCVRTGRWDTPIIYYDAKNRPHRMKSHQVLCLAEMPSPIENMRGMQYCVLTRLLRAAQVMRDIGIYKAEKISGRFTGAVHLVSGVQGPSIEAAIQRKSAQSDAEGLTRYVLPIIIASLDPTAHVSTSTLELASLPDGFDEEVSMKWYINQIALAFGGDYQDYAPLPGGGLGSSRQSETLHLKSRGKGSRMFMRMFEQLINFHGILPRLVTFQYGDQDVVEDLEHADLRKVRAEERAARITSGEITPEIARQIAVDVGDLDPRYLTALGEADVAEEVTVSGAS